ncbi:MAG: hypothetical protein GWN84_20955, partial [Gammaproteobacteria bacterium]|nr:hypothetical protein [Gammaproteobacteria bacterium]NIR85228.1 hypothetical protein [Gammaproteobacteria bacterium]NIU05759.1 hypothetical protein [Gammaproteobacteria bacterium]NIX87032.1 hypothetical protein [Gammaproteobacteria bacterium]
VTREDLERSVWRGSVVGYDALTGCIAKLRKALEDDPRRPRYIETISKKGYRLIGEISGEGARSDDRQLNPVTGGARRRRLLWGAVIGGMILALLLAGLLGNEPPTRRASRSEEPAHRPPRDRRPAVSQRERCARAGLLQRRDHRGHHHGALQALGIVRDRPVLRQRLPGTAARSSADRRVPGRALRRTGQRAALGRAAARERASRGCRHRRLPVVGEVRPAAAK